MKVLQVAFCAIMLHLSFAQAQSKWLCKGFRALDQKNFGIACDIFYRFAPQHQSLCAYGKTLLYSASKEFYAIDSALFFMRIAIENYEKGFQGYTNKERIKFSALGWNKPALERKLDNLVHMKFQELVQTNSIQKWNEFISLYKSSNQISLALRYRDSLWMDSCAQKSLFCLKGLKIVNPNSAYENQLTRMMDKLSFEEWVVENLEEELATFILYHPESQYVSVAEDEIYQIYLRENDTSRFKDFLKNYPENRNHKNIWKAYYGSCIGNYSPDLMAKFIALHPDYPFVDQVQQEINWYDKWLLPIVDKKGLFGFMDEEGNKIIDYAYEEVSDFHEGLAIVMDNGKFGAISPSGERVIDCKYDVISDFHHGRAIFSINEKYGLIDRNDHIILQAKYDDIQSVFDTLFLFMENSLYGIMDSKGEVILAPIYCDVNVLKDNKVKVFMDNKTGIINSSLVELVGVEFDDIIAFNGGYIIKKNGKYGVMDALGKTVLSLQFDLISDNSSPNLSVQLGHKFSFLRIRDWKFVTPWTETYKGWTEISGFNGSTYLVKKKGQHYWSDTTGKIMKPLKVKTLNYVGKVITGNNAEDSKLGIMDRDGNALTAFDFDQIDAGVGNALKVFKADKAGVFSDLGDTLIPPVYDDLGYWSSPGLWWVELKGKKGVYSKDGEAILPPQYTSIAVYSKELLSLQLESELLYFNFIAKKFISPK
ncbi:MAG: hypothetical protein EB023_03685 [Flavobacteriia bacterium]|nr:hypothetical protein [Flavobacteriia bacterium]